MYSHARRFVRVRARTTRVDVKRIVQWRWQRVAEKRVFTIRSVYAWTQMTVVILIVKKKKKNL